MTEDRYISKDALRGGERKAIGLVIRPGSVTEEKIADKAISTNKIKEGAITMPKLSPDVITLAQEIDEIVRDAQKTIEELKKEEQKMNTFFDVFEIEASDEGDVIAIYEDFSEE